jgi:tetratricopeptide (TPR) repeat protein
MRALTLALLLAALAPPPASAVEPAPLEGAPRLTVADVVERGDRAYAGGDLRAALFAYQDAVKLEPGSAGAHVKLARVFLALRDTAQARAQAEQALALDAGNAEARRLLDDASSGGVPARRDAAPAAPGGEAPQAADARAGAAPPAAAAEAPPTEASLRYRAGVDLLLRREYALAVEALDLAVAADRKLGVAYAARGSAQLGLGRALEATHDYRAALELEPGLAMPLYGLAECYRALGDPRAVELYRQYAESRAADVREDLRTLAVKRAAERRWH